MFQLDDFFGAVLTECLDSRGVAEIVRPLHRVVGVLLPRVALAEGGVDATLGRARVTSNRVELGDEGNVCTLLLLQ